MLEKNTDRLFWTLTSIIVGALLLTISVKAFPSVAETAISPITGIVKQADTSTKTADQAFKNATNSNNGSSNSNSNSGNSQSSQPTDPDAQAKANAVEASTLNLKVTPNGDGTGVLAGPANGHLNGTLNIPKYVKVNGQLTKITSIGDKAFYYNDLTPSVNIPNSVTSIGKLAFAGNQLTSVTIPNNVTNIGDTAFGDNQLTSVTLPNNITNIGKWVFEYNKLTSVNIPNSVTSVGDSAFQHNKLTSVNIPNQQAYQSAQSNTAFDPSVTVTNNHSSN